MFSRLCTSLSQQAHSRSDIGSNFGGWTTSRTKNRNVNALLKTLWHVYYSKALSCLGISSLPEVHSGMVGISLNSENKAFRKCLILWCTSNDISFVCTGILCCYLSLTWSSDYRTQQKESREKDITPIMRFRLHEGICTVVKHGKWSQLKWCFLSLSVSLITVPHFHNCLR